MNVNQKKKKLNLKAGNQGLSLLELILALVMLSIMLLASGSLNLFALRAANINAEEIRLQNQLEYVMRDMEMHITESRDPIVGTARQPLILTDPNNVQYQYAPAGTGATFSLSRCPVAGCATSNILSDNVLTEKIGPDGQPMAVFQKLSDKSIQVNLAAQSVKNDKTVTINGMSKIFFLRGSSA